MTHCIVKLTTTKYSRLLWQHPTYHSRPFTIKPPTDEGYVESVYRNDGHMAQFKQAGKAQRYIDFMLGKANRI